MSSSDGPGLKTGNDGGDHGPEAQMSGQRGWLFLTEDMLPERWRDRAMKVFLVPLFPDEASTLLKGEQVDKSPSGEDERLLRLVARGYPAERVAKELSVSLRSVERRLARLRQQFNVSSTRELINELVARGF